MELNNRALDDYERLYSIELTDEQRTLLLTQDGLLEPMQKQIKYLLGRSLAPIHCPGCQGVISVYAAAYPERLPNGHGHGDNGYACPLCRVHLRYHLGLIDGAQWFTVQPGNLVTPRQQQS